MAYIKSDEDIRYIIEGGKILGQILEHLSSLVKPGISAVEIDTAAEKMIREAQGRPAFKGYRSHKHEPPFPSTICACLNAELVHGIATPEKIIKDGDIFSIDIGMQYPVGSGLGRGGDGFFTDTAITIAVGKVPESTIQLLNVTKKSLEIGIQSAQNGQSVAAIGRAIEDYVSPQGYGIVRDLVGHGVGYDVHEDPRVPNFYDPESERWTLRNGVVIAIEPMITMGHHAVETADDGWSIRTADGSLCAHFEHTIVITDKGPIVVTRRPSENK